MDEWSKSECLGVLPLDAALHGIPMNHGFESRSFLRWLLSFFIFLFIVN